MLIIIVPQGTLLVINHAHHHASGRHITIEYVYSRVGPFYGGGPEVVREVVRNVVRTAFLLVFHRKTAIWKLFGFVRSCSGSCSDLFGVVREVVRKLFGSPERGPSSAKKQPSPNPQFGTRTRLCCFWRMAA